MTIRVVVVDDQDMVRSGFAAVLSAQSAIDVVGEASNGRLGVEVSRSTHPDVVLMDVRMPEMDGLEAARRLLDPPPGRVERCPLVRQLSARRVRGGRAARGRGRRTCRPGRGCGCGSS